MRLAVGWLAVAALAAAHPLHGDRQPQDTDQAQDTPDAAQDPPTPPANRSEEVPSSLVDVVMQLAVDLSRLAMELHHSGGSRSVTAQRINMLDESSLLLTFHRSADAAAALLTPEGQMSQVMSVLTSHVTKVDKRDDMAGRAMDYESSAEASLSEPLPLKMKPLPPPVVPQVVPIPMPMVHVAESSSAVVTAGGVGGEKEQRKHPAEVGGEKQQSKKAGEVSERSGVEGKVSRTVVALLSDHEGEDPYGLRFLLRFLEAIHRVVDVVKSLVGRLGGFRGARRDGDGGRDSSGRVERSKGDGGRGVGSRAIGGKDDGGGSGGGRSNDGRTSGGRGDVGGGGGGGVGNSKGADAKGKQAPGSPFTQDVVDRVASLLGALEPSKDAQPARRGGHKAPGR